VQLSKVELNSGVVECDWKEVWKFWVWLGCKTK